jgi:hypothetical protein
LKRIARIPAELITRVELFDRRLPFAAKDEPPAWMSDQETLDALKALRSMSQGRKGREYDRACRKIESHSRRRRVA